MNYKFGAVILINFSHANTNKKIKRPALVILDTGDDDVILAPVTTKEYRQKGDGKLQDWKQDGLLKPSWVRLAKISCLAKASIDQTLGELTDNDKMNLLKIWRDLYQDLM